MNIAGNRIVGGRLWEVEIVLHLFPTDKLFSSISAQLCSACLMLKPQSVEETETYAFRWQPSVLPPKRLFAVPQRYLDLLRH